MSKFSVSNIHSLRYALIKFEISTYEKRQFIGGDSVEAKIIFGTIIRMRIFGDVPF